MNGSRKDYGQYLKIGENVLMRMPWYHKSNTKDNKL
jgi:hypothetical protein